MTGFDAPFRPACLPGLARFQFRAATVYLMAGLLLGIVMAAGGDFTLKGVHGHMHLLGWVTLALTGTIYALAPHLAEGALACDPAQSGSAHHAGGADRLSVGHDCCRTGDRGRRNAQHPWPWGLYAGGLARALSAPVLPPPPMLPECLHQCSQACAPKGPRLCCPSPPNKRHVTWT